MSDTLAATSGSFGLLKPKYHVTDDRVTISRNVWLPLALLALAVPGIWCLVQAFTHTRFDSTLFGVGFVGTMAGLFALVMTPWLTPRRIVFSREGVAWGGAKHPRQTIASVRALSTEMRSSQYGRYLSWTIVVALVGRKPLVLSLGNRHRAVSPQPLVVLERAIHAVLSR